MLSGERRSREFKRHQSGPKGFQNSVFQVRPLKGESDWRIFDLDRSRTRLIGKVLNNPWSIRDVTKARSPVKPARNLRNCKPAAWYPAPALTEEMQKCWKGNCKTVVDANQLISINQYETLVLDRASKKMSTKQLDKIRRCNSKKLQMGCQEEEIWNYSMVEQHFRKCSRRNCRQ